VVLVVHTAGGAGRRDRGGDQGDDRPVDGLALRVDQLAQALLDRVHVAALDRLVGDQGVLTGLDHAGQAGRAVAIVVIVYSEPGATVSGAASAKMPSTVS
jgi:hypothetical protein